MNDTKMVCGNCKYYLRHYVIDPKGSFVATTVGHCAHYKIRNSVSNRHVRNDEGCALWQPYELQKLSVRYSMEQSLQNISDKVGEMLAVLLRDTE